MSLSLTSSLHLVLYVSYLVSHLLWQFPFGFVLMLCVLVKLFCTEAYLLSFRHLQENDVAFHFNAKAIGPLHIKF